jgi:hypothetical protein
MTLTTYDKKMSFRLLIRKLSFPLFLQTMLAKFGFPIKCSEVIRIDLQSARPPE